MLLNNVIKHFKSSQVAEEINNIRLIVIISISIAVVLSVIGFIFINFIMKKEFDRIEKQIGIFKALGYSKSKLSLIFAIKVFVILLITTLLGYLISLPIQIKINQFYVNIITVAFNPIYAKWWFMLILFLIIPTSFALISFLIFQTYLSKKTLHLISQSNLKSMKKFRLSIKKLFHKCSFLYRIQLAFTLKSFGKWLAVCIIFMITTTLLLISFVAKDIIAASYNNIYATYDNEVKKIFWFDQDYIWSTQKTDPITNEQYLAIVQDYPISFTAVSNEQTQFELLKQQAQQFHNNLTNYIDKKMTHDFLLTNFTHQAIYLDDFKKLLQQFEIFLEQNRVNINQYTINLEDLKKQLFKLTENNQFNDQTFISINQYWYNPNQQLPFFQIEIYPQTNKTNEKMENFNLTAFEKNSNWSDFWSFPNIKQRTIDKFFNWNESDTIPLIISKKASLQLKLNLNDDFNFLVNAHKSITFKGKIVEIAENETFTASAYTDYDQIIKYFKNWNGEKLKMPIYTNMLSKSKYDEDKKIYQNYAISINGSKSLNDKLNPFKIKDFIGNPMIFKAIDNVSFLNGKTNFFDVKHAKKELNLKAQIPLVSLTIVQILLTLLVLIIIVIIFNSIIDENRNIILTFKVQGYKNQQINFIVIGNYIIGFIFAFILGYFLSLALAKIGLYLVSLILSIHILMPWNFTALLITLVAMSSISFTAWLFSNTLLQQKKPVEITKQT